MMRAFRTATMLLVLTLVSFSVILLETDMDVRNASSLAALIGAVKFVAVQIHDYIWTFFRD